MRSSASRWPSSNTWKKPIRRRRCCRPTPSARAGAGPALGIACDTHPLNNLRVLKYLKHTLGVDEDAKNAWYRHWVHQGLQASRRN